MTYSPSWIASASTHDLYARLHILSRQYADVQTLPFGMRGAERMDAITREEREIREELKRRESGNATD